MRKIVTSESVGAGHPDKTCDIIADAFLDEALRSDPSAQMAVECAIKNDKLFIYGESTTSATIDYDTIAKKVLHYLGYDETKFTIIKEISEQSVEINHATISDTIKANDQGIVYGYACNETKEYMPLPIMIAHKLMQKYEELRLNNNMFFSDAKSQVSIEYEDDKPVSIHTILMSVSHSENISHNDIESIIKNEVINVVLEEYKDYVLQDTRFIINPSGKFTIWGSFGDSGCVGRKIVVDTYGGVGRVGGGCFSSKNSTKVDRSGAYFARFVAKDIVALGLADKCEIQLSFGIGLERPISIYIDTFGTEKKPLDYIYNFVDTNYDFRVGSMIKELGLNAPIYSKTACFGHFGRAEFPWEKQKSKYIL